ncbi:MAG: branched chain amino acid aminotransferase, partial [Rhizobium sp.]
AAVLVGIGLVRHAGGEFLVGDGQTGKLTSELRQQLVSLQKGVTNDERGWTRLVSA